METVTASSEIVDIAGTDDTSGKLNMWAKIIKWLIIVSSLLIVAVGISMVGRDKVSTTIGLALILAGIINGFMSFLYVYLFRALAIITEAASIIVLEHNPAFTEE